jgi:methionyl-tRNA formyltransferase
LISTFTSFALVSCSFGKLKENASSSAYSFDGFDTGAILAQEEIKIYPSDTGKTLKDRTVLTARGIVCELLKDLDEDIIIPLKQNEEKASYYSHPCNLELDFKKSAEENYALIRAIYPWSEAYFYHNVTALTPNPHKVTIEENKTKYTEYGTVVEVDVKTKTIAILCGDNKILKMSDINLLKKQDRLFTKNYISCDIKIGDIII